MHNFKLTIPNSAQLRGCWIIQFMELLLLGDTPNGNATTKSLDSSSEGRGREKSSRSSRNDFHEDLIDLSYDFHPWSEFNEFDFELRNDYQEQLISG